MRARRRIAENQAAAKAKAEAEAKLKEAEEKLAKMEAEKKRRLSRLSSSARKRKHSNGAWRSSRPSRPQRLLLPAANARVYVVQGGDSLSKIAKEQLGNAARLARDLRNEQGQDRQSQPDPRGSGADAAQGIGATFFGQPCHTRPGHKPWGGGFSWACARVQGVHLE